VRTEEREGEGEGREVEGKEVGEGKGGGRKATNNFSHPQVQCQRTFLQR